LIKSKKLSKFKYIKHAFLNKLESKATGMHKSLNCSPGSFDSKKKIFIDFVTIQKKIKSSFKKVILLNQIHSNKFYYIDKNLKYNNKLEGDALITNRSNTMIGVLTADCAPILLHDKNNKMVAAIHAGWRGAFKGIVSKVVKFMIKKGCTPENMTAVIGPCISIKSYEVKQNFIKKFIKKDKKNKIFFKKIGTKNYFNLNKYVYSQLKSLKIKNIETIKKDTFDIKNNFYSARRSISFNDNNYSRNISIIMIN